MCLSISATVALGCMFAPKLYIVLFQPHKNVRQSVGIAAALNPQRTSGRALLCPMDGRAMQSPLCLFTALPQGPTNTSTNNNLTSSSSPPNHHLKMGTVIDTDFLDTNHTLTGPSDDLPYMDSSDEEDEDDEEEHSF